MGRDSTRSSGDIFGDQDKTKATKAQRAALHRLRKSQYLPQMTKELAARAIALEIEIRAEEQRLELATK